MGLVETVGKIRGLEKELHHYMDQIFDYEQDGKTPQNYMPRQHIDDYSGMTVMDLVKTILVNRPYISRYKNDASKHAEVKKRKEELDKITDLLNSLGTIEELLHE